MSLITKVNNTQIQSIAYSEETITDDHIEKIIEKNIPKTLILEDCQISGKFCLLLQTLPYLKDFQIKNCEITAPYDYSYAQLVLTCAQEDNCTAHFINIGEPMLIEAPQYQEIDAELLKKTDQTEKPAISSKDTPVEFREFDTADLKKFLCQSLWNSDNACIGLGDVAAIEELVIRPYLASIGQDENRVELNAGRIRLTSMQLNTLLLKCRKDVDQREQDKPQLTVTDIANNFIY